MKGKGLFAVFGVIAAAVVVGVLYFGTGANQQASIGALKTKTTTTVPLEGGVGPITINPNDPGWTKLCRDGKPHLQVLSPNGGEVYQVNQELRPTWRSCNVALDTATVEIFEVSRPANRYPLGHGQVGFGTLINHTASIQNSASLGRRDFKVQITQDGVRGVSDTSNTAFTINGVPSAGNAYFKPINTSVETTRDSGGRITSVTFINNYSVTAENSDIYLQRACNLDDGSVVPAPTVVIYSYDAQGGTPTLTGHGCSTAIISGASLDPQARIVVQEGTTANLRLTSVVKNTGAEASVRQKIKSFGYMDETNTRLIYTVPTPNTFVTQYVTF